MADFVGRIEELIASVEGDVVGTVVVDQVYAKYQHEGLNLRHPQGGQAKYLAYPLMMKHAVYAKQLADGLLHDGSVSAMKHVVEDLSDQVFKFAPVEFWDLRRSGHPIVNHDDVIVYDRPPLVARLTAAQLKEKDKIRALGRKLGLW